MTCHLEAHEGADHYKNRNKNLAEIFAGAKTDPHFSMHDATVLSHHMFVCGDLNYRIDFGDEGATERKARKRQSVLVGKKRDSKNESGDGKNDLGDEERAAGEKKEKKAANFDRAKALVDAQDWKALNESDELARALRKRECLAGFRTLPCNFPPTFKVERGEGYQYIEKRTPR